MNADLNLDKASQLLFIGGVSWILGSVLGFIGATNAWLAFFTFWIIGSVFSMILSSQKFGCEGKAVLITGCDSGFGHQLALQLDTLGFRVFACCLLSDKGGEGATTLKETGSKKMHVIQMNVTSEDEVKRARAQVDRLLPKDECLWGIVNNAGLSSFGNLEWVPISTYKKIADVNIFGMINVTKGFLPLIKKARGRVINVASMMGRFGAPMRSAYAVTKYAVEGLSECLRQEMNPLGVNVVVIEPGNFIAATSIFTEESVAKQGDEMWKSMTEEVREDCGEENFKEYIDMMKTFVTVGDSDTTPVINCFKEALTQKYPLARYAPVDPYYKARIFVSTHLPEWIHDLIYVGCMNK